LPYVFQYKNFRGGYIENNKENISPCLLASLANVPYIQEQQTTPRRLTPRECLRLQGFNDDYQIVVSDTQIYKQVGNAVAVPVVQAIGQKIKASLINFLAETGLANLMNFNK
jgi:DNA (cytosine-5)-methyltransferase 1